MKYIIWLVGMLITENSMASAPDTLWTRTYGGAYYDWGYSVQQTTDGGFIIAGEFGMADYNHRDVYLIRTDSSGDTLWTRTYGGVDSHIGKSVQQTSDGGFIVAGTVFYDTGSADVYLIRVDSSGDTLWTRAYGGTLGEMSFSVQQTQDSGFIIAGFTYSFGAGESDAYLIRTNSSGDTLWTRTYGGAYYDWGYSVQQTTDSGFIIAGQTHDNGGVYIIRTDSSCDTLWTTNAYGGTSGGSGRSVRQTSDGGFIIAGYTYSFGAGWNDVYLIRLSKEIANVEESSEFRVQSLELNVAENPFCQSTSIRFEDSRFKIEDLRIQVYDMTGRLVEEPGRNIIGKNLSAGIYFLKIRGYEPVKLVKIK